MDTADDRNRERMNAARTTARLTDLADILDQVHKLLTDYVAFPNIHGGYAAAVWTAHTHARDAFESTPRMAALSPEPGSGKTRLLEAVEVLVAKPVFAVNITASALFRMVAQGDATILLDEADTYLGRDVVKNHEDIRALVNSGHRRSGVAYRTEMNGKKGEVVAFPAYAPCALAGIGDLPDTILDRSVVIAMKRRAPEEVVIPFREREARQRAEPIRVALTEWAAANTDELSAARPVMPEGITDRNADVWEPLIVIGDMADGVWSERIRDAAVALTNARRDRDPSLGLQLLADCHAVFHADGPSPDRLRTETLIAGLVGLEERPWSNLRGEPLDARGLARFLKRYDVRPAVHKFDDVAGRGYLRVDFEDAWARYLPASLICQERVTSETAVTDEEIAVTPVTQVTRPQRMREPDGFCSVPGCGLTATDNSDVCWTHLINPTSAPGHAVKRTSEHGAQFTSGLLEAIPSLWIAGHTAVLDPFAGLGNRIAAWCRRHDLDFYGFDIEEWPGRNELVRTGDATNPASYPPDDRLLITSPTYGNGVNDHFKPADSGRKDNTYRTWLGRDLHENNSGRYTARNGGRKEQRYWAINEAAVGIWATRDFDALVNVKDFPVRQGIYPLADRWSELLTSHGYTVVDRLEVPTPGIRYGANTDTVVDREVWLHATRTRPHNPPSVRP